MTEGYTARGGLGESGMEIARDRGMPIIFTNEDYETPSVKGGFGIQKDSTGKPCVIPPIRRIPVTFEEFMEDEKAVEITTHDNTRT